MVKKDAQENAKTKNLYLYVEGGGNTNALRTACREGFAIFLSEAGLKGHMPRIVACGSRQDAFASYCTAIEQGQRALLLVDSEAPVAAQTNTTAGRKYGLSFNGASNGKLVSGRPPSSGNLFW